MTVKLRAAAALGLALRPAGEGDQAFLDSLYASTRAEEMAATGWPPAMQAAFLAQQHQAQQRHYRTAYPDMAWLIVERSGNPVGRLCLDAREEEVRVVDISLLPEARGNGIGGALLRDVIRQASALGRPVALSVMRGNPARRLYQRLGFEPVAGLNSAYEEMVRRP